MKLRKFILTVMIAVSLISVSAKADSGITIYFNGSLLSTTHEPVIENGTTLVPLSDIANAMGVTPDWDAETKTINIRYNDLYISMRIGNTNIAVYNAKNSAGKLETSGTYELKEAIQSLIAPKIIDGYTYIPLKALSEAFGAEVEWNGETKTIRITAETADSSVTFKVDGDTLTVSGSGAMEDYDSYTTGSALSRVGSKKYYSAIPNTDDIKFIVIEDGVTHIGDYTFANFNSLESVIMADSVVSIGTSAFAECENLEKVTVSKGLKTIGSHAFVLCHNLEYLTLPYGLISIGDYAFSSCYALDTSIPDTVTYIGKLAFFYCKSLKSAVIPHTMTSIEPDTFGSCKSLTNVSIPSSVTSIGGNAFSSCTSLTSVTIPNSVTSIGIQAFWNCENLTDITISDNITSIEKYLFCGCTNLSSIKIPKAVTNIDADAFCKCSSLKTVYCEKDSVADNKELYPDSDVEFVYY